MGIIKKRSKCFVVGILAFVLLCFAACAKQPDSSLPTISYSELMRMMDQTIDSDIHEAVSYKSWWGVYDDRLWTCGMQPGGFDSPGDAQLWIASCDAMGGDTTALQLHVAPDLKLVQLQKKQSDNDPEVECLLYQQLYGINFDNTGTAHPLLFEQVRTQNTDGEVISILAEQYTYCTIGSDGQLVRGPKLQLPYDPINDQYTFSPTSHILADDNTLWVCVTPTTENKDVYKICTYLRFSTLTGECTAQVALPDDHIGWDQILTTEGDILVFARQSYRYFYFFFIQDITGNQPVVSERIPFTRFLDSKRTEMPTRFVRSVSSELVDPTNILMQGDGGVWKCNVVDGTVEKTVTWLDYDLQVDATDSIYSISPEQFLILNNKRLKQITLVDKDALAMREVVTFALMDTSVHNLRNWVSSYNATDPEVYVKVLDYTDKTAQEKGYTDGLAMLVEDIRYNKQPDIIMLQGTMDIAGYTRRGMFLDLYPYLDADPQLSRNDFIPGILTASEYNGALPSIIPAYTMLTAAGAQQVVGTETNLTWNQYDVLCQSYPEAIPFFKYNRNEMLLYLLQMGGDKFIDRATASAYLDTPDFVQLLENCATYPQQGNNAVDGKPFLASGDYLLYPCFMGGFRTMLELEYFFDGTVTFVGFPSNTGDSSAITPSVRLAISSTCEDPDAAWAFLRTFLLDEFQSALEETYPLRKDSLEILAQAAQQPEQREIIPQVLFGTDYTEEQLAYWKQGLTSSQTEKIVDLIYTLDTVFQRDNAIINIIWEEADAFYNGARTAEEAAAIMQNRVQTYLDEQG